MYAALMRSTRFTATLAASFVSAVLLAGCSSGTTGGTGDGGTSGSSGSSGSSGGPLATPQAILVAKLVAGSSAAACPDAGKTITIGAFDPQRPVADDAAEAGGKVNMSCTVIPGAAGFDVNATVELSGAMGGAVTLVGSTTATGSAATATMSFTTQGVTFAGMNCVLDGGVRMSQSGAAAGRYWAGFKCVDAVAPTTERTCNIEGEIRIENCTQR